MKIIKTLYLPIYKRGNIVHVATIRSDWSMGDYSNLAEMFKVCFLKSKRLTVPVSFIGQEYHNLSFKYLGKFC